MLLSLGVTRVIIGFFSLWYKIMKLGELVVTHRLNMLRLRLKGFYAKKKLALFLYLMTSFKGQLPAFVAPRSAIDYHAFVFFWTIEIWQVVMFPHLYKNVSQEPAEEKLRIACFWWILNGGTVSTIPVPSPEVLSQES